MGFILIMMMAMTIIMSLTMDILTMGTVAAPLPRWNGYDAREYKEVIEEHKKLEDARREVSGLFHQDLSPHILTQFFHLSSPCIFTQVRKAAAADKKAPEEDDGGSSR